MCGICGIIGTNTPQCYDSVKRMTRSLTHRGPDDGDVKSYAGAVLGHRRLSIIDLSHHGHQPMECPSGRYVLVFNGEIYNFKELRRELSGIHEFRGHSDTEVLLAAYLRWGENCLNRLNGMFAFCIYDRETQSAFFARDRFGQKPLYLHESQGRIEFGSEVKALIAGGIKAEPNYVTWSRYLATSSYDDSRESFFAGITQLMPGECAIWRPSSGLSIKRYYRVADHIEERNISAETAAGEVRDIMIDAVRLHMRADVPIAVSLSGGLDSSALIACLYGGKEKYKDVASFSVEFGEDLTEKPWIDAVASRHGISSHMERFEPSDFLDSLQPMTRSLEGPIGGLMTCALERVSAMARQHGFTVIQDGTGLDEAFGGYRNHHNLYVGHLLVSNHKDANAAVLEYARNWGVDEATARHAALKEINASGTTIDGTIPVRPDLLSKDFLARYSGETDYPTHVADPVKNALIDYLEIRKIPRNTRMKDRMSMAHGLELRLPFLDHRLVEYAMSLPPEYLFLEGKTKSIVRRALFNDMNSEVRTAAKRSIQAPQGSWLMAEPLKSYIQDLISSRSFADRGLFNVPAAKIAFDEFCQGKYSNSFFVWQWINTEEWFRNFIDNPSADQFQ
jgi:asparagine synthase (glutamine-hydrolysing)